MKKKLINKSEKIFIAGSTGMAGGSIKRIFHKQGYGAISNGGKLLTPTKRELDLLNKNDVDDWFEKNKPSVVVIAAAKVGGILINSQKPADFLLENLKIQNNIIEAAWRNKVKRTLFLGSSCIYPKFADQPIREESLLNSALEPTNEGYALAKIAGIKLCQFLRKQYGFDSISLMPTNLYGTGDNYNLENSHVLPAMIRKFCEAAEKSLKKVTCWGSGLVKREFLHVDDLGKACLFALENWNPDDLSAPKTSYDEHLTFLNVGTGLDLTIKELAEKIAFEAGFKGEIIWDKSKPEGTPQKKLDVSRINSLGWFAKTSLDEGIKKTILEFKSSMNIRL